MVRALTLAALLAVPAIPAAAETPRPAGPGALAGRSPQQAYRTSEAKSCAAAMHSIPAGKLPVFGTHALSDRGCDASRRAAAGRTGR